MLFWVVIGGAGLVLLLTGSIVSGGRVLNLDPTFARITGGLLVGGSLLARVFGSPTLLIVTLILGVGSLVVALVRGVTR